MQQRYNLFSIIIALMLGSSAYSMQQALSLSLHRQAEQKQEAEIKSLDDAPARTIKLIAQDGQTIEVAESYLKSSNYFQRVLEDKEATEIPLCTITDETSTDLDEVSLQAFTDILKTSCIPQHNSLSDAITHSSDKRLLKLYYMAMYFDISNLIETLEPSIVKILSTKAHLPEYMQMLQAWDPAWQKRLAKIALANNRDILDFYSDNLVPEKSFIEEKRGEAYLAANQENIAYCINNKLTLWKHEHGKTDNTDLNDDPHHMLFSPNGKNLLIAKKGLMVLPINEHGRFKTFDLKITPSNCLVKHVSWSPDSKQIIFVSKDRAHPNQVYLYDFTLDALEEQKYSYEVEAIAFSPTGTEIAATDKDGILHIIDRKTNDTRFIPLGANDLYDKVTWAPNGTSVACYRKSGENGLCSSVSRETNKVSHIRTSRRIHNLAWSPKSDYLAIIDDFGNIMIWDVNEQVSAITIRKKHQDIAWQTSQRLVAVRKISNYSDYIFDIFNIELELSLPQVSLIKEAIHKKNPAIVFQYPQIYGTLPQSWKNAIQSIFKKYDFSERWYLKFKALSNTKKKYVLAILGVAATGLAYGSKLLLKHYNSTLYDTLTSYSFFNYMMGVGFGVFLTKYLLASTSQE